MLVLKNRSSSYRVLLASFIEAEAKSEEEYQSDKSAREIIMELASLVGGRYMSSAFRSAVTEDLELAQSMLPEAIKVLDSNIEKMKYSVSRHESLLRSSKDDQKKVTKINKYIIYTKGEIGNKEKLKARLELVTPESLQAAARTLGEDQLRRIINYVWK